MSAHAWVLTTTSRVSSYMEISVPTGSSLTSLEAIINSVTDFIENYCGRRFKKTAYVQEVYSTEEAEIMNLKNFPVSSSDMFLLELRTSALNEDDWEAVDSEGYHVDYDNGIIVGAGGNKFARTVNGYRVTYTAGYDFDNVTTFLSDTAAADVELAAWMLVEAIWNKRRGGSGIERESIGDYSVTYRKEMMANEDIRAILDRYAPMTDIGVITPLQS